MLDILTSATNSAFFEVLAYIWGIGMWIWFSVQVGTTGSSPGMRVVGLKCVSKATGQNIGTGTAILRWVLHIVDSIICFIGWFMPLWDSQRQTLSDKIVGSLVYRVQPEGFSLLPKKAVLGRCWPACTGRGLPGTGRFGPGRSAPPEDWVRR